MNVSRLRWISRTDATALAERLNSAIVGWQSAWSVVPVTIQVAQRAPFSNSNSRSKDWIILGVDSTGEPISWVQELTENAVNACSRWLGVDAASLNRTSGETVMEEALGLAELSLFDDLRTAFEFGAPENRACEQADVVRRLRPWSGAAQFEISGAGVTMVVGFSGKVNQRSAGKTNEASEAAVGRAQLPAPVTLSQAVQNEKVVLSVTLSNLEIALGELASLTVGDVLRTDHLLSSALQLNDAAGNSITRVSLGSQGTTKAIRFLD